MGNSPIWPNFFIAGAAKAGTTSLYAWLRQHPQVYMSPVKEPHYFSSDLAKTVRFVVKDEEEYLKLFEDAVGFKAIGEASASYLPFGRTVASRIRDANPDARIIILLRDPVERCYSDYLMYLRSGRESRSFYDALVNSPFSGVYIQKYAEAVRGYLEVFGSSQVLVLMFEELKSDPQVLMTKVATFLELDQAPITQIDFSIENTGGTPKNRLTATILAVRSQIPTNSLRLPLFLKKSIRRILLGSKPPIDPRAIDFLRPVFAEDLAELERLLGRPLPELREVW